MFENLKYQNVSSFFIEKDGKKERKVFARLYNTETKKTTFHDVTHLSVPDIFIAEKNIKSKYSSYVDESIKLKKYSFSTFKEQKDFLDKFTITKTDKNGEVLTKIIEFDGEEIEIEDRYYKSVAHGYLNPTHTFLHRYFLNGKDSIHNHRKWFIDIETRSGVLDVYNKEYFPSKMGKYTTHIFPHSDSALHEITLIQIYDSIKETYYILGRKHYTNKLNKNEKFFYIPKERDLLEAFLKLYEKMNPSIITGFNSKMFDIPYITNRIARILDNFDGDYKTELNYKNSYRDFKNVSRLSPLGVVEGIKKSTTLDGMEGNTCNFAGVILLDYRELIIKYGYLGLSSVSLKNVAKHFNLTQKIDTSQYKNFDGFYTGEGWIEPENPDRSDIVTDYQLKYKEGLISKEELQHVVYNRFVEYGINDVKILVELDNLTKYLESHLGISYICSVPADDNWRTQKHWVSLIYKEAFKHNIVLPLNQQFNDFKSEWLGGWTRAVPGHYKNVTSFDFTSLYPSLIRAFNIGGDTYLKDYQLNKELLQLRNKYFNYYSYENLNRNEKDENGNILELGKYIKKYSNEINDIIEEGEYFKRILDNKDEISKILKKYNVCVTPNGFFYKKDKQSVFSNQMETIFKERLKEKRLAQKLESELQNTEKEKDEKHFNKLKHSKDYHENVSQLLKIFLNSAFGAAALESNPFSNGKITGSSITTSGRFVNRCCAMAVNNYINKLSNIKNENEVELNNIPQVDTDSFYVDLTKLNNLKNIKNLKEDEKIKLFLKLSNNNIMKVIDNTIANICDTLNLYDRTALNMENEIITKDFISLKLKRYFTNIIVKDGKILNKEKIKIVGVSLISYSTSPLLKELLRPVLDIALKGGEDELRKYIQDARKKFEKADPTELVRITKVNNIDYIKIGDKYKRFKDGKWLTAPLASTAALNYNTVIEKLGLIGKYHKVEAGDTFSYFYIKDENKYGINKTFGFTDPKIGNEINLREIADYDIHWEKDFMNKIDIIIKPMNWNIFKKTKSLTKW